MAKHFTNNYPLELLRKSKNTLEATIKGAPGIITNVKTTHKYREQIRELKRAIEYLELFEERKQRQLNRS